MFKVINKITRTTSMTLLFLLFTLNFFTSFSSVSILGFEQVIVSWDKIIARALAKIHFLYNEMTIETTE